MGKKKGKKTHLDSMALHAKHSGTFPLPFPAASKHSATFPLPFPASMPYPKNDFLRDTAQHPYNNSFRRALETSYEGFCVDNPSVMKDEHQRVKTALLAMERAGFFRADVTQPFGLGTKCAKTYVTRCLVGEPGTTYKYLGLRMFSHSWRTNQANQQEALRTIFDLNRILTERTKEHLSDLNGKRAARNAEATRGRLGFDITLINLMESTVGLKDEPSLGQGKCSVSWHADSSLENFSNIAVYHLIDKEADADGRWSVGLRVAHNSEGPHASRRGTDISVETKTPPLTVSLPSGSTYYMLDDFNHHHQHAVIAEGKVPGRRFSSTHRLLRDSHNVKDIIARCKSACANFHKKGPKVWRSEQLLLTEMESEWLRQFFIQGQAHHNLLWKNNWQESMEELLKYWSRLEERTKHTIDWLQLGAEGRCGLDDSFAKVDGEALPRAERKLREKRKKVWEAIEELLGRGEENSESPRKTLYEPMALLLEERAVMRELWLAREHDGVFHDLSRDSRPMPLPVDFLVDGLARSVDRGQSPMPGSPKELRDMAAALLCWGTAYESGNTSDFPAWSKPPIAPKLTNKNCMPLDWDGWKDGVFGLEMQDPWAMYILTGEKKIETRAYSLPAALIGRKIIILQSRRGKAGVSALGDTVDLHFDLVEQVGWCEFDRVITYRDQAAFEADKELHMVESGSGYGWQAGLTEAIFGWVVGEYGTFEAEYREFNDKAIRRHRSLFELQDNTEGSKRKAVESTSQLPEQRKRTKRRKKRS